MNYVTLTPAYGRDYKSKKTVLADWEAGKDFIINQLGHPHDGSYINKQDAERDKGVTYNVRYNSLRSVLPIKIK